MLARFPLMIRNHHPLGNHQISPSPGVYVTAEHYHKVSHFYLQGNLSKLWYTYFKLKSKQKEHQHSLHVLLHFQFSSVPQHLPVFTTVSRKHTAFEETLRVSNTASEIRTPDKLREKETPKQAFH